MGILKSLTKLWKKKNQLRSKISPISREIDKMTGMDQIWSLPGAQLRPDAVPSFSFTEDTQNVLRLGGATVNPGGYRAVSPAASANGKAYPSSVLADTMSLSSATPTYASPTTSPTAGPSIARPLPGLRIPTTPGLSTIRAANRPYTM